MTEWSAREHLVFHPEIHVMEVDFEGMTFDVPSTVHAVYDEIDERLEETGKKWFFLVNYRDCRIMSEAWISFAHRGKMTNIGYSLGSVRFAASSDTAKAIRASSREERFDPNLFRSREDALAQLDELRKEIPDSEFQDRLIPTPAVDPRSPAERIVFHSDISVMETDFSDHTFATSADVNRFYDELDRQIRGSKKKWYFLVNYTGTEILPEAWYSWALRGKALNADHSLGTVRYDPVGSARQEIVRRGKADDFNPNLVGSREEGLARIAELKAEGAR